MHFTLQQLHQHLLISLASSLSHCSPAYIISHIVHADAVDVSSGSAALEQGMGLESNHPRQAEILDQLSLFQFLQGKLPEAEMHARRSLAVIHNYFEMGDPAVCMCELRLGAILFSEPLLCDTRLLVVWQWGCCHVFAHIMYNHNRVRA